MHLRRVSWSSSPAVACPLVADALLLKGRPHGSTPGIWEAGEGPLVGAFGSSGLLHGSGRPVVRCQRRMLAGGGGASSGRAVAYSRLLRMIDLYSSTPIQTGILRDDAVSRWSSRMRGPRRLPAARA